MTPQDNLQAAHKTLYRPRIQSLIREGLQSPLLVMLAGPGYGKTQAMSDYVTTCTANVLWLRLGALDNLSSHFWNHLVRVLKNEYPCISARFQGLEFPTSNSSFEAFTQLMENSVCGRGPVMWVFDDYGEINNQQVKNFIQMLVGASFEDFRLVLLSNVLSSMESVTSISNKCSLVLTDDLRFTKAEIREIYHLYGIVLRPEEADIVEQYTEGWPLPLFLLVLQHDQLPDLLHQGQGITPYVISHLFEERFYSAYSQQQQKLLIKLSLLDSFPKDFFINLYEGELAELKDLENHAFIINEPSTDRFYLHHLYRLFLQEKIYWLTLEEQGEVWQRAADYFMNMEDYLAAIACYLKCENYLGMMEAIDRHIQSRNEMTEMTAVYLLKHIELLPTEQVQKYPRADYLRAWVYMILVRLEEAEELLLDLEKRLLCAEVPDKQDLLCDICTVLGLIHMMQNRDDFYSDFQKAAELVDCLSPEQKKKKSGNLRMLNGHAFSMADNLPGAKERMERAVHNAAPCMTKIWSGDISGIEHIFSAESAYLSFQLDSAKQHAYRCIRKAEAYAQHDLVCNAHLLLARIGYAQGDLAEMTRQVQYLKEYAASYDIGVMRRIRDTALGWYYVKLHDHQKIPESILEFAKPESNLSYGRPQLVCANYLINTGEYARLVGMLEQPKGLFLSRGIWPDRISQYIMLAIGYHCLGNNTLAMDSLGVAYDMCYHNELITLFIEAGVYMKDLIGTARKQGRHVFSAQWLDLIYQEADAFAKRTGIVRAAYHRQNSVGTVKNNPLSQRELKVLQAIARGLTQEEIAAEQYISVNTVKSAVRSIYNKLDANNKAKAVSVAITSGYIDGYKPEPRR